MDGLGRRVGVSGAIPRCFGLGIIVGAPLETGRRTGLMADFQKGPASDIAAGIRIFPRTHPFDLLEVRRLCRNGGGVF